MGESVDCRFYQLVTRADSFLNADRDWLSSASGHQLCSECTNIDRLMFPHPLDVVLANDPRTDRSLGLVSPSGVSVFSRSLLEQLLPFISRFVQGACSLSDGTPVPEFSSLYSEAYVIEYKDKGVQYYPCSKCGTVESIIFGEPGYLLAREVGDAAVVQSANCRMYVRDDVAAQIDWDGMPDVFIRTVPVRAEGGRR